MGAFSARLSSRRSAITAAMRTDPATQEVIRDLDGRAHTSEQDRLDLQMQLGERDRKISDLEAGLTVHGAALFLITGGVVEARTRGSVTMGGRVDPFSGYLAVDVRGAAKQWGVIITSQSIAQREQYFVVVKEERRFILECRTNADVFVDLSTGSHAVQVYLTNYR